LKSIKTVAMTQRIGPAPQGAGGLKC